MKSLRPLPIVISVVLSAALLFGGLFVYRTVAMHNPLVDIVNQSTGVQSSTVAINDDQVDIKVKLDGNASLREIYENITSRGSAIIGKREVKLGIDQSTSPELEAWWSSALFEIAEAMDTKQYAKIPVTLKNKAAEMQGLKAVTEMDDNNVYIQLTSGDKMKFIILPRTPAKMGVWPNE